ncbi:uncharacterized protein LOC123546470 isoform X2 [Mercenaria mercenaria]|uniref:uncharacterized protein LOC123546470 isoform X2 n=1 Tax=Mercenaria mercenaria TaxID=6596 RepID=UPI00234EE193|nr:uncharacterized protein LOC123546470 isoform X2 [Mercenaria mercenaria]
MCWSVDRIAEEVRKQTDKNDDGIITYNQFSDELVVNWNLSNNTCLSFEDFTSNTSNWVSKFHDHHDTAHKFFKNLDLSGDNQLCLLDVAVQLVKYDTNPVDGQIQPAEFNAFMHAMHPDSHQNLGHGHGLGC